MTAVVLLLLGAVFAVAWTQGPKQTPWQRAAAEIRGCHVSQIQEFRDRTVALTIAIDRDRYGDPVKTKLRLVREPRLGAAAAAAAPAAARGCTITASRG